MVSDRLVRSSYFYPHFIVSLHFRQFHLHSIIQLVCIHTQIVNFDRSICSPSADRSAIDHTISISFYSFILNNETLSLHTISSVKHKRTNQLVFFNTSHITLLIRNCNLGLSGHVLVSIITTLGSVLGVGCN